MENSGRRYGDFTPSLSPQRRGFTIVEMIVTLGIIIILSIVVVSTLLSRRSQYNLQSTASQMASMLRNAQSRSINQENGTVWGVHFENSTSTTPFYALFYTAYSSSNIVTRKILPSGVRYSTSTLVSGASLDITFAQVTGIPSLSTSIVLELTVGNNVTASSSVVVAASGLVTY